MKSIKRGKIYLLLLAAGLSLFIHNTFGQVYGWSSLGDGVDGNVYAITMYNNKIVIAGEFQHAGGFPVNNIAQWDGANWSAIGNGLNDTVYALLVDTTNNTLYAGGHFVIPGNPSINHIARWNGSAWVAVGNVLFGYGVDGDVRALTYHYGLVAGGSFSHAGNSTSVNNITRWNNVNWETFSNGLNDTVYCMTVDYTVNPNILYVGGKFTQTVAFSLPVGHIASWNQAGWNQLNTGMNNNVYALTLYNGDLYAGGTFTAPGVFIAHWTGTGWQTLPPLIDDNVLALGTANGKLVAGGSFKFVENSTIYASRIAQWNGTDWSRMVTGTNNTVNALFDKNNVLYAGGKFTTAGGDYSSHIGTWDVLETDTVSGRATYLDNGQPVGLGKVVAVRIDVATREIITVDSFHITTPDNGFYQLMRIPKNDSLYILILPDDEELDNFVPTYHPSTIDWMSAVLIYPITSLSNVDIQVIRAIPRPMMPLNANISGYVYLNFTPPFVPTQGYPFWSGSIVYAKEGNMYRGFGVSDIYEHYTISNLPSATYDLYANRLGYYSGSRVVALNSSNYDTANFWLDTSSLIGVQIINTKVPDKFELYQNYPNPFNPATIIKFSVQKTSDVRMSVFNVLGQEVAVLVNETLQPGEYRVVFNASTLASGVYFYKVTAGSFGETRKMVLIK